MGCLFCTHGHTYGDGCLHRIRPTAKAVIPTAVFHLENGKTVKFSHVNVDSIGPQGDNPGVISVEFDNDLDRIVHIPFVVWWEITYP